MSGHTPGPWAVPHLAQPDVKCDCGYVLVDHLMGAVATVHTADTADQYADEYPPREEAKANARLIAAAPLMLEALENLENDDGTTMPASAWTLVLDAIEAATGERPNK
jgi:hypothetical protein